jgi:two-component system, NarL family, sensor histidine kinase DegS
MSYLADLSAVLADVQTELWVVLGLDQAASLFESVPEVFDAARLTLSAVATGLIAFGLTPHPQPGTVQPTPAAPTPGTVRRLSMTLARIKHEFIAPLPILVTRRQWRDLKTRINFLAQERTRLLRQCCLLAETLRVSEEDRSLLAVRLSNARADERQRIAQDLHDQAGQELATTIAALRSLRDRARGANRRYLDELAENLCSLGQQLHHAILGEHPRIVEELGLCRALEDTIKAYAQDGGLRHAFSVTGKRHLQLPSATEAALYRIAQEAMTNVVKHAAARSIKMRLIGSHDRVSLIVSDDGTGFEIPSPAEAHGSVGLGGMTRRMTAIGGVLQIDTGPGLGTTVTATLPLVADSDKAHPK